MKIGAFAKQLGLNISTVRFYVNNGLLVPSKKNDQYEFDRQCIEDMKKILEYKAFHFSLEEIQLLFFLEKTSRFQDEVVLEVCTKILKTKKQELQESRRELDQAIEALNLEIERLPVSVSDDSPGVGIPFAFIPYLSCPHCQMPLKLDAASLSNGFLLKGELWCDCGYKATLEDGLVFCQEFDQETPFKAFNNIDSVFSITNEYSPSYRLLIEKTYLWMYNQISARLQSPGFILAGPFTLNFLLEYIEKLGSEHTYIVVDPSLKRIKKIRQYLSHQPYKIIYIVGKPSEIPVKHGQISVYIDDFSTVNSLFTYNDFGIESIAPLLKKGGCSVGIFTGYEKAPRSLQAFKLDHPDFRPEKMTLASLRYAWEAQGLYTTEKKRLGQTNNAEKHFPRNVVGESVCLYGYMGVTK